MFSDFVLRRRAIGPRVALAFVLLGLLAWLAPAARAADTGVDVTATLADLAYVVIASGVGFVVYLVRDWMNRHTNGQSEQIDWNTLGNGLAALANSAVHDHLLAGRTVTIDTRSELANRIVMQANTLLGAEIKRLGLTDQSLAVYAGAAAAKVLNLTPAAPPFVPPPVPAAGAVS